MNTSARATARPAPHVTGFAARRDFAWVLGLSLLAAALCVNFNVSEALLRWAQPRERFQVDELPAILLAFASCMVWFSWRRYREARREIELRRRAEGGLTSALAENRRLAQQYLDVQESDRRALARDLHDELGQYLNAIKVDAVAMRERLSSADPVGCETAGEMIHNIDRVQGVVLGLIRQLRPVGLDELGLAAALEHCVNEWSRRLPAIEINLDVSADLDSLDEKRRLALYRLVQEGLTNVARHSNATRVAIRIERTRDELDPAQLVLASIDDNGIGARTDRSGTGLGLVGMRERAEAFGGSLSVTSAPGAGFKLLVRIPVEAK
jgi:two-component system, NarL family, sensor histidine kinase UhpB